MFGRPLLEHETFYVYNFILLCFNCKTLHTLIFRGVAHCVLQRLSRKQKRQESQIVKNIKFLDLLMHERRVSLAYTEC
jgi:hypothetical protein